MYTRRVTTRGQVLIPQYCLLVNLIEMSGRKYVRTEQRRRLTRRLALAKSTKSSFQITSLDSFRVEPMPCLVPYNPTTD